jgi:drug/metabolite transporter (DMT)-like permease
MATLETPTLEGLHAAALPIAYAGIMSCAVAYTLQIVGQKRCDPVVATVLMSLESVFSLLGGLLLLQQVPTPREALGCCVMFTAVLLSQLPVEHLLWRRKEPVHT